MIKRLQFKDKEEWLKARKGKIGGSDAAAVVGLNPYKTNQDLFKELMGSKIPEDISNKPYVLYGTKAEEHIRAIFALDHPEYEVEYFGDNMLLNDKYPFAHASLDGELVETSTGRRGIFECKTTEIFTSLQNSKWDGESIPNNYYIQVLHYLLVTGYSFVELRAQIKTKPSGKLRLITKDYHIEREDVKEDIGILIDAELEFYKCLQENKMPALRLPTI